MYICMYPTTIVLLSKCINRKHPIKLAYRADLYKFLSNFILVTLCKLPTTACLDNISTLSRDCSRVIHFKSPIKCLHLPQDQGIVVETCRLWKTGIIWDHLGEHHAEMGRPVSISHRWLWDVEEKPEMKVRLVS